MPKIDATPITRWKCAVTKYVSWKKKSSEVWPSTRPVIPPATKSDTKPIAKSIGVVKRIRAPQSVPNQLKVLIAEGTPIDNVRIEKAMAEYGLMPLINM